MRVDQGGAVRRPGRPEDDVPITRETSERLTSGVARLLRTGRQLGHTVAAGVYGGLPSSGWALLGSLEQGGEQRCGALAARMGVDLSVASRQVSALERAGYVARRPDPLDGRASLMSVSDEGVAALARVRELRCQWAADALDDWSEDDAHPVSALLERLADDLERISRRRSVPQRATTSAAG
jgi:DNA-binding MarR family transcriptional regulator